MNSKSLNTLEYLKILEILSSYATSPLGKEKILNIKPMTDSNSVMQALRETSEATKIILQKGRLPIDGLNDIQPMLKKAKIGSVLSPGELLHIGQVLKISEQVKDYIKEERTQDSPYSIINNIIQQIIKLPGLTREIFRCIISEEELADNASEDLYRIRKQINQKNNAIREKLNKMIQSTHYQKYLQEPIVTIRGDRYVVPVKQEYRSSVPGLIHDQSSTGATLFIEPMTVVELNNDLKTLENNEKKEIERILIEFTTIIGNNYEAIYNNFNYLTNLDILFAKGYYSIAIKATEPKINSDGVINFKQARHPLIDPKQVVASNIYFGEDFHTLVITGPNTGGKTVTLKTIGLLCLMAQSGLHIPAKDNSEICIFNKVFADIGDEQSIEQSLSTFSSHMTNIVEILEQVDEKSLVLFDELGAGTDPTEGAALAMSILDFLHKKNIRTVATTHYTELKEYALTTPKVENASVEFDVESLKPTYVLLIGIPGKSNAFEIAQRLGLKCNIIDDAKKYVSQEDTRFEDVLLDIEKKRKQMEEDTIIVRKDRMELESLKSQIQERHMKLEQQKDKIIADAKRESLEIIKDTKEQMDVIIKNLHRLEQEQYEKINNRHIEDARMRLKSSENHIQEDLREVDSSNRSNAMPKNLKPGDAVFIANLNQKGNVLTAPDEKNEVQVQVGIMKINVHLSNISKVTPEENKTMKNYQKSKKASKGKTLSISPQLDLRGKTSEEAIMMTDKYLDDAYLSNLNTVTIIHGKGTGVLRKSIHELLKRHVHVKEYRIGGYNEGGEGASIVIMK